MNVVLQNSILGGVGVGILKKPVTNQNVAGADVEQHFVATCPFAETVHGMIAILVA